MPSFTYAAKDSTGKTVEGTIQAGSKAAAVEQLRSQDLIVLKVDKGGRAAKSPKVRKSGLFATKPRATKAETVSSVVLATTFCSAASATIVSKERRAATR